MPPNSHSLIQGSDGNFYGTTAVGIDHVEGTVFKITPSGTLTTIFTFVSNAPAAGVIQGSDGNFYGSAINFDQGGSSIFKLTPTGTLTTLATLSLSSGLPYGLVQGSDDNFYGTTNAGGSSSDGTIFKLTPSGTLTTLVNFTGSNGENPENGVSPAASLVQGSDGNFYGTTYGGGTSGYGTVFKVTPSGTLTTLTSFNSNNGANPQASLIQGSDGNFYGTTYGGGITIFNTTVNGGNSISGTVFKITPSGTLTTLVSFPTSGAAPQAGLIQGSDGNFYGTTTGGGSAGGSTIFSSGLPSYGTAFKLTPSGSTGTLTTLVSFNGTNGEEPSAALILGTDGNFYGTTNFGGTSEESNGIVFKLTPSGTLTTVFNFNGTNGDSPNGLVLGSDGNFYGTTYDGGSSNDGTVFKITPSGTLTTLVNFNGTNGTNPLAALIQGSDGNFYGTTISGGSLNYGEVFVYNPATSATVSFSSPTSGTVSGSSFAISGMSLNLNLAYAPTSGTVLTILNNTGTTPISGTYSNLPDGGTISATYNSTTYTFVANYEGGLNGNSLTLTYSADGGLVGADTPTMPQWMLVLFGGVLFVVSSRGLGPLRTRT